MDAGAGLSGLADPLASLRRALDHDGLQIFCQPIRALRTGEDRFSMAEVLVRLREEEDAPPPPGDFLPVFEHYRMMCELDCWVVRKTVERIVAALPGSIWCFCINVSSQSLDATARSAAAVHAIGCEAVIDGFAPRSVSFLARKALQPAYVKIDGAVVRKIGVSSVAQLKMKSIVRVGAVTGIGIIAECVEQQAVIEQLTDLSVGYAQGFGIAVPQPIALGCIPPG